MTPDRHDSRPLAPDDPRLSEWLDGRLTAAEAAEVERLVAASPALTKLVADLRGMRGALGAVPVTPPPAGFVRDVLAAIDASGGEAGAEAEVEAEWRRIERQRLEEEIAEAEDDAAEPVADPMRQRWPWLALVGALAAGMLVAIVINRGGRPHDREVALVHEAEAGKRSQVVRSMEWAKESAGGGQKEAEVADSWLEKDAEGVPADVHALDGATARDKTAENATALAADRVLPSAAAPPAPMAAAATPANAATGAATDARAAVEPPIRTVTYRIRTAADRRRLDDLLAASGGVERRTFEDRAVERLRRKAAPDAKSGDAVEAESLAREAGPAAERIVLSGPAVTLAGLAAALEAAADADHGAGVPGGFGGGPTDETAAAKADRGRSAAAEQAVGAAAPAARLAKPASPEVRAESRQLAEKQRAADVLLVIEIVDESGPAGTEGSP